MTTAASWQSSGATATVNDMRTPAPPRELLDAMGAAWDKPAELAMLNAQYRAWLRDTHGIGHNRWDNA